MHVYMGGSWDTRIIASESGKARGLVKVNPEEIVPKSGSKYLIVWLLPLSEPASVSIDTAWTLLFLLLISPLLFLCFLSLCGDSFAHSWRARALSVVWDSLTVTAWLPSVAGNCSPASNHYRPRPPKVSLTVSGQENCCPTWRRN